MYFDYKLIKEEVTSSWSRCLRKNRKRRLSNNKYIKNENNLNCYLDGEIKRYFLNKVKEINNKLEQSSCFFLINNKYIIEGVVTDFNQDIKLKNIGIQEGFSFSEKDSGTNAVFLAGKLKKPVHILPGHHFCQPLNSWYSIAYPIMNDGEIYGYINVISEKIIKNEIICLTELLVNNIQLKIKNKRGKLHSNKTYQKLSEKQKFILKKIANGLTEQALAKELSLSKSTIKYHKKKLFDFFNAESNVEMVVKAFKDGLLSLNEVSF